MYLIVGLGNPGKEYENTKHNVGFIALDQLAERNSINIKKKKHKGLMGEGIIGEEKVILLKPQTYMNLSGQSVISAANYFDIPDENIVIIYDDIDISLGSVRIRKKGSAGTHNGMKSIVNLLGSKDFPRIRIGIGREKQGDLKNYVLGGFNKKEVPIIENAIIDAACACEAIVSKGIENAMQKYNKITKIDEG